MSRDTGWDALFQPKVIAIVGASRESGTKTQRYGRGAGFIGLLRKLGFPGRIYPIHPGADEVMGYKAYPKLTALPEPADLVIVTVSAPNVPAVLEDCVAAGAKSVHVFSSGFGETGEKTGQRLEERVKEICQQAGLRLVGPNCMGLHLPRAKVSTFYGSLQEAGPVAFLSQSGGHTRDFVASTPEYGIGMSKVISYGNGTVLDSTDYLAYLATDSETQIIGLYVEGVREGKRFLRLVREINRNKPIVIWKGGVTATGARAVAAHTGSLAGDREVWKAFFRHTGAVEADSLDELLDVIMTFLYLASPPGRRAGVLTMGGGQSVASADLFTLAGLEVPLLPQETREKLSQVVPPVNTSFKNPVDLGLGVSDVGIYQGALQALWEEPSLDFVVVVINMELVQDISRGLTDRLVELLCSFAERKAIPKPVAVVLGRWEGSIPSLEQRLRLQQKLLKAGIVAYPSLSRACSALAKFLSYREFLSNLPCRLPAAP